MEFFISSDWRPKYVHCAQTLIAGILPFMFRVFHQYLIDKVPERFVPEWQLALIVAAARSWSVFFLIIASRGSQFVR